MKKKLRTKNLIITILSITIVFLVIGFIYLSITINNISKANYDVSITKVEEGTKIKGGKTSPTATYNIENNNKTIDFNFKLNSVNDSLTYKVTIKNNGNLDAKIDNIVENIDSVALSLVSIKHNDIKEEILKPGEKLTLTITVTTTSVIMPLPKNISYQISILTSSTN